MEPKGYKTKQKVQIIEFLKSNKNKHLTVDEMLFLLSAQRIQVSRATLYRYLDYLVNTGEVRKYITGEQDRACYQYIDSHACTDHFHLMCLECGSLLHLKCEEVNKIISHLGSEHNFIVDPGRVVLYGICEKCQNQKMEVE